MATFYNPYPILLVFEQTERKPNVVRLSNEKAFFLSLLPPPSLFSFVHRVSWNEITAEGGGTFLTKGELERVWERSTRGRSRKPETRARRDATAPPWGNNSRVLERQFRMEYASCAPTLGFSRGVLFDNLCQRGIRAPSFSEPIPSLTSDRYYNFGSQRAWDAYASFFLFFSFLSFFFREIFVGQKSHNFPLAEHY